jgi:hypothetical protein
LRNDRRLGWRVDTYGFTHLVAPWGMTSVGSMRERRRGGHFVGVGGCKKTGMVAMQSALMGDELAGEVGTKLSA